MPILRASLASLLLLGGLAQARAASTWTQIHAGSGGWGAAIDTGLSSQSAVYDPSTNSMIVFGGSASTLDFATANETLLLSNANGLGGTGSWTTLIPKGAAGSPPPRSFHSAAYDARMIVFGGATYLNGQSDPSAYLNDVWVLENANGAGGMPVWVQLTPSGAPPHGRYGQSAVYDATANRLIVFGGSYGPVILSDVWVLSHANGLGGTPAWTQLSPEGSPPPGGYGASAVYDAANHIVTIFGGYTLSSKSPLGFMLFNGVWTLSHANGLGGKPQWTNIVSNGAAGSPGRRDGHTAVYDSASNRMIVFGGGTDTPGEEPCYNDVWVLAFANGLGGSPEWTQLHPTGLTPGRRAAHSAIYDPANNRMVIFAGGSDDAQFYSPWILTGANGL